MLSERFPRSLLVRDYSIEFARFRMRKLRCYRAIKPSIGAACELVHGCIKTQRFSAQAGRGVDGALKDNQISFNFVLAPLTSNVIAWPENRAHLLQRF